MSERAHAHLELSLVEVGNGLVCTACHGHKGKATWPAALTVLRNESILQRHSEKLRKNIVLGQQAAQSSSWCRTAAIYACQYQDDPQMTCMHGQELHSPCDSKDQQLPCCCHAAHLHLAVGTKQLPQLPDVSTPWDVADVQLHRHDCPFPNRTEPKTSRKGNPNRTEPDTEDSLSIVIVLGGRYSAGEELRAKTGWDC